MAFGRSASHAKTGPDNLMAYPEVLLPEFVLQRPSTDLVIAFMFSLVMSSIE